MCIAEQDATDEFNAIHSAKAKAMLNEYLIGRLGEAKEVQAKLPGIKEDEVFVLPCVQRFHRMEDQCYASACRITRWRTLPFRLWLLA